MRAILTYHSIDPTGSPISVAPEVFRAHHQWLASGHVRVLTLDDLIAHTDENDAVAVTFDDGFLNTRGPVEALLDTGFPVTLFVVTGHVGGANDWGGRSVSSIPTLPLLAWRDLEALAVRGVSVAAHTRTHPALSTLPRPALDAELAGAQDDLRRRLGIGTVHLAYPYGDVDARVVERASDCYAWGYTTEFRALTDGEAPLRLPRLDMYYFRAPGALEAWGTARFMRHMAWCRARRRIRAALAGGGAAGPLRS
jgi:peptidoglycan/xylan/chitin deacetylase (PgdA/CDA1 family)